MLHLTEAADLQRLEQRRLPHERVPAPALQLECASLGKWARGIKWITESDQDACHLLRIPQEALERHIATSKEKEFDQTYVHWKLWSGCTSLIVINFRSNSAVKRPVVEEGDEQLAAFAADRGGMVYVQTRAGEKLKMHDTFIDMFRPETHSLNFNSGESSDIKPSLDSLSRSGPSLDASFDAMPSLEDLPRDSPLNDSALYKTSDVKPSTTKLSRNELSHNDSARNDLPRKAVGPSHRVDRLPPLSKGTPHHVILCDYPILLAYIYRVLKSEQPIEPSGRRSRHIEMTDGLSLRLVAQRISTEKVALKIAADAPKAPLAAMLKKRTARGL